MGGSHDVRSIRPQGQKDNNNKNYILVEQAKYGLFSFVYQEIKLTRAILYNIIRSFRQDLDHTYKRKAEKQAKVDYERTVEDWHRMNLVELKKLPPNPRYHFKKAIVSYLGTTPGSSRALAPLTKVLDAATPEPISQP